MPSNEWRDLYDVNEFQRTIMQFVDNWVRTEKTPVPQKQIVKAMKELKYKDYTTVNALNSLNKKGYLRVAIMGVDYPRNQTFYVQLRRVG